MNAETAFVGPDVAFVARAFKVGTVGIAVAAQHTIVTACITNPAAIHRAVDVSDASVASC